MIQSRPWGWLVLFLLGAYHGINPGMGWLFAVARGMQQKSARAVVGALGPIAIGHALAIGVVVLLAKLIQILLPLKYVQIVVAALLLGLGVYRIVRARHFRWGGMQVRFHELTLWSFLMASAHGAGLMVLPVVLRLGPGGPMPAGHHMPEMTSLDPLTGVSATLVHTLGYLVITAAMALVVYQKLGLSLLRRAWFNLDLVWAGALIVTGGLALVV